MLVIIEYAPHGNLREYLRDRRPHTEGKTPAPHADEVLSLRDFISFSYQVARGMEFLSSMKVIASLCLNEKNLKNKCILLFFKTLFDKVQTEGVQTGLEVRCVHGTPLIKHTCNNGRRIKYT